MQRLRISVFCLFVALLAGPLLHAQDLSKYRDFSFGMKLPAVLKHTEQKSADVNIIHTRPALIQELTWWPPPLPGPLHQADAVQQMLFSFCNGELYKIFVTYDPGAVQGLTADDLVQSISARYGTAIRPVEETRRPAYERDYQQTVASWEDSQYSLRLVPSLFSGGYALVILSKHGYADAETAIADAAKLDDRDRPQKEADLHRQTADSLEIARQKNRKVFQP